MNTKQNYKRAAIGLLAFIALTVTVSCSDYLEEKPSTSIDSGYIYTTEEGLKSGVVSLYTFNRARYEDGTEDYMGGVYMSSRGDLTFSRSGYAGNVGRYERGVSPIDLGTNLASRFFWKPFYKIANKATDIINAAEVVEGVPEKSKNQIIAEAKFWRAYSYFYLYKMYNNIYVSTESVTVDNAFNVVQNKSSKEEIFNLLKSDLKFAIDNLEWKVVFGRVSKGTAKHLRAQVAMWEGDWDEAKVQSLAVIEDPSSPHKLVATTADVFKGNRSNTEQLFVIQAQDNLLGGGTATMLNANYVAQYFQIPDIIGDVTQGGRGFSRIVPNNYLLGLLAEDPNDTRDDNTYFRLKFYYNQGVNTGKVIDIYQPKATATSPAGTHVLWYQRLHPSCVKFTQEDDDPNSYTQRSNITVFRLAETYLIAAEAMFRSGSGDPLKYINAVRTRAKAAPFTTLTLQRILDENARELAFEGERFFTLKRFGQATLNTQMRTYSGDGPFFTSYYNGPKDPRINWQDHYINFPIFQDDLNLLGPNYPQNDKYN